MCFKPMLWFSGREQIVQYPHGLLIGNRYATISAIRVLNQFYDGNTARAQILSGGIGRKYVKIRLTSRYRRGFRYWIYIYGR